MARRKSQPQQSSDPGGAPEWMVTFSDCMTLLLTFFVLLLSFSSFDNIDDLRKLKTVFSNQFSFNPVENRKFDALLSPQFIEEQDRPDFGSEQMTISKEIEDGLKKENLQQEFRNKKVFIICSEDIFWGKGAVISTKGQEKLSDMAAFLKMMTNRILISENFRGEDSELGMERAWAMIDHFVNMHNLERDRFNMAAGSTIGSTTAGLEQAKRQVEIVLLERSICN